MPDRLHWSTVTPVLKAVLTILMQSELFQSFRLVGGTCLSLQLGHRMSDDIDLFTDEPYGSIDFGAIDHFLRKRFSYVSDLQKGPVGMGVAYLVGNSSEDETVKLDLFSRADEDFNPKCLRGKYWELIKLDIVQALAV